MEDNEALTRIESGPIIVKTIEESKSNSPKVFNEDIRTKHHEN